MPASTGNAWRARQHLARWLLSTEPSSTGRGDGEGVGQRATEGVVHLLNDLCSTLADYLGVTGVAVNLMPVTDSGGVAAASNQRSRAFDELQFTTGEGPCHDAFATRRPVLVGDLRTGSGQRWPGYSAAAVEAGLVGVFAFPLYVGGAGFGVLDVFSDRPSALDAEQVAMSLVFAEIATEILLDGRLLTDSGDLEAELSTALDYRAEIHQAQGMLMVSLGVSLPEALVRMRSHAFTHSEPLIDLARDVLAGHGEPHFGP